MKIGDLLSILAMNFMVFAVFPFTYVKIGTVVISVAAVIYTLFDRNKPNQKQ